MVLCLWRAYVCFTTYSVGCLKGEKTCVRVARRSDVESRGGVCSVCWRRCARVLVDCDRPLACALCALGDGLPHPLDTAFLSPASRVLSCAWCNPETQCCSCHGWKSLCAPGSRLPSSRSPCLAPLGLPRAGVPHTPSCPYRSPTSAFGTVGFAAAWWAFAVVQPVSR